MVDRHLLGDVALAVLLSIPIAALARPEPVAVLQESSSIAQHHIADVGVGAEARPVSLLR